MRKHIETREEKQLKKLKSLENINTPVEGIVFQYDGNLYKLTGNFAPINQLLGFFKYGRSEKLKEKEEFLPLDEIENILGALKFPGYVENNFINTRYTSNVIYEKTIAKIFYRKQNYC